MDENLKVTTKKLRKVKITPIVEQYNQPNRDDLVRETAYKLFEERHYEHGHAESDWLTAEARINKS